MASQLAGVGEAKSVLTVDPGNLSHDNNSLAGSGHHPLTVHIVFCVRLLPLFFCNYEVYS